MPLSVVTEIQTFNQGRDPERLALKFQALADNPFSFLRGTCHLFHRRLLSETLLRDAPRAWICGDLHTENFGSYKADSGALAFDMNDFDEVALAPVTLDILRLLTSIRVALADPTAGIVTGPDASEHRQLLAVVLEAYAKTLAKGKALRQEAETARGLIADLLTGRKTRSRSEFIAARTVAGEAGLQIRTDHGKALPVSRAEREQVSRWLEGYASGQPDPGFYQVRDVAQRIAGTGSLGLARYVILVAGKASDPHNPEGHYLLDLKAAAPSCLAGLPGVGEQPDWGPPSGRRQNASSPCNPVCRVPPWPAYRRSALPERPSY